MSLFRAFLADFGLFDIWGSRAQGADGIAKISLNLMNWSFRQSGQLSLSWFPPSALLRRAFGQACWSEAVI